MEWLFPWGSFLKRAGGTITGNLIVQGVLTSNGGAIVNTSFNVNVNSTFNGPIKIIHDDGIGSDPHIILQDATVAGVNRVIGFYNRFGAIESFIYSTSTGFMGLNPKSGGTLLIPDTILEADPLVRIPLQNVGLGMKRNLMLNTMIFS